ncbi:MAG: ATP synthase subunit I [Methylophilaceae bacterium]
MDQTFRRMIKMQMIVTLVIGIAAFALAGLHSAVSVFAGGGSAIVGSYFASLTATSKRPQDAGSVLIRLLKAEAVKIVVIVLLLWLTFKFYNGLVPLALIIGLAGAALFSGAAVFAMNEHADSRQQD